MSWPGEDGTLRDILKRGILAILEELEIIRDQMDKRDNSGKVIDLSFQVASLSEGLQDLEHRVTRLEEHKTTVSWILVLLVAMSFGVLLAYLIGLLR